jgi:hypothetical protein
LTFFQDLPVPEPPRRGRTIRYVPPVWAGAPRHELPEVVAVGRFLHLSPTFVMAVEAVKVYSTGCLFDLSWKVRRHDENDEEWAELNASFFSQPHARWAKANVPLAALLCGVEFADGSKASTGAMLNRPHPAPDAPQPEPPVILFQGQGGSGGDDEMAASGTLWLWPLPPAGAMRLVTQWTDMGMPETSIDLDGTQLREAAAGAQQYWPEGDGE